jgi:hypothetical protein
MNIFHWKRTSAIPTNPFDLSESQVKQLTDLTTRPGYAILQRLLREVAEHNGDRLLTLRDHSEIRERQGFINAIRHILNLIPNIQERTDIVNAERARLSDADTSGNGPAAAWTGYGGPWRDVYDRIRRSTSGGSPGGDTA